MRTFLRNDTELFLQGPEGKLEVKIAESKDHRVNITVICCHPHPLYGGSMENKVVTTVFRTFSKMGANAVRFNYRGVGKSTGSYANAMGETDDLLTVIDWVRETYPHDQIWLAGFSFGAYVVTRAAHVRDISQLITIAPPVNHFDFKKISSPSCPWLIIQGDADEVVPPEEVFTWLKAIKYPYKLIKLKGAGHFFHGRLVDLSLILEEEYGVNFK